MASVVVLLSSIAIVIGPTPPGTGVIAEATSFTASKSTSPTRPFSVRLMPTSMTDGPRLHHRRGYRMGSTDRGHEDVGLEGVTLEILRPGVADGHRRIRTGFLLDQKRGQRLTDDVRATDDHDIRAVGLDVGAQQHLLDPGRRRRRDQLVPR